ncbi:RNA polymerase sigma-70 factor (ECF subfamily) [Nocardioides luteus]|uniref:DNA-directed RNA polymerase sigma-70 factor n=1 Tax=Nocardioides luteus TaxID=1844 RepID=A0ABQ5T5E2_9ACTN|nr:sigma-70 family RNA polymerase sigma factor [Nocardioides luteus]MDR7310196.1 RNA polymerase sigma-70 factor (ECF subfamily) [Nocardioides luteus]GGR69489.1 DNA-directed RNA polymerase sigma-70 factor [Nocardioides luteus]GLJ70336.1 DNA-directed RNA polymerase sigma-70 factor [Nocardioides luteus]
MSHLADRLDGERFEASRDRLASLAYRLLGSASEAEDTVQDAYLRWQGADRRLIEVPEAWLTKVVTNLSLDRLRSARMRNERASAWLPEPVLDGDPMLGPAETVEQREMVSLAVLTVMERLSPVERGVYVLREAFSYTHAEIAEILEISEAASQQHLHRARRHVAAGRRRDAAEVDPASARRTVEEFLRAATSGEIDRLVALLTDDATAVSDGAGIGARVLRYDDPRKIAAIARAGFRPSPAKRRLAGGTPSIHYALVNGAPAIVAVVGDHVVGVVGFDIVGGRIATVRGVASAQRLGRLGTAWAEHDPGSPIIAEW